MPSELSPGRKDPLVKKTDDPSSAEKNCISYKFLFSFSDSCLQVSVGYDLIDHSGALTQIFHDGFHEAHHNIPLFPLLLKAIRFSYMIIIVLSLQ